MGSIKYYIDVYRPSHWFKNFFMLVGSFSAYLVFGVGFSGQNIIYIAIAFACTCLAASANYGINEVLDAEYDQYHPVKKQRPIPAGKISPKIVIVGSVILAVASLAISYFFLPIGSFFGILALLIMGLLYNIKPIRTKELAYLDVISESINNPIRFVIGWYAMSVFFFPPASFLTAFWAFGAFLMACKRLAEYRFINDPQKAASYRRSFSFYDQEKLITSIIGYLSVTSFALAIICIKYSISLVMAMPVFAASFVWYFRLTLKEDSPAKEPEKLLKHPSFYFFTGLVILAILLGRFLNPYLEFLFG